MDSKKFFPDYSKKVQVASGYVASSNGWIQGRSYNGDLHLEIYIDGLLVVGGYTGHGGWMSGILPIAAGQTMTAYTAYGGPVFYFIPVKS